MNRWMRNFLAYAGLVLLFYQAFPALAAPLRLVALGDSLTAGYGLAREQGFAVKLEEALKARGHNVRIVNAGVSGDTTAGGLARLDWTLAEGAEAVMVALGANDMLRGLPPLQTERNLDAILTRLGQQKLPVLLLGMKASVNLGADYVAAFDPIFARLAKKHGADLYPFFLEGVALTPGLNQEDGLHPNAKGVEEIVRRILPKAERLLGKAKRRAS